MAILRAQSAMAADYRLSGFFIKINRMYNTCAFALSAAEADNRDKTAGHSA